MSPSIMAIPGHGALETPDHYASQEEAGKPRNLGTLKIWAESRGWTYAVGFQERESSRGRKLPSYWRSM